MKEEYAKYLLEKTEGDYNVITEYFSTTRNRIWENELKGLEQYTIPGDRILDLGCGNGRLLEIFKSKEIDYIGVDFSEKLIEIAKKRYPKARFQKADALNLPFPKNYFDKVFSIAVLHHIPSLAFRLRFLQEIKRVLKPKGLLILNVWNMWPRKGFCKLFLKYTFLKIIGKSKLDFKDIFYRWKNPRGEIVTYRYIHIFSKKEIEKLAKKVDFKIKESWLFQKGKRSNIFLIAENK